MHNWLVAIALIPIGIGSIVAVAEPFHTSPLCWNAARIYHPGGEIVSSRMQFAIEQIGLARVKTSIPAEAILSPNGAYSYAVKESDASGNLAILIFNERPYLLELSVRQTHALNEIEWISERMLFLRLWFARIGGVDAIFDVEQEEIVLMQPFQDGQIAYQQWHESCSNEEWLDTDVCNVPCHYEQTEQSPAQSHSRLP